MDDRRIGAAFRAIRIRRGLRQVDVAEAAGVSRAAVGRLENGTVAELAVGDVRAIAGALDARIDLLPRWGGGGLGRVINERHAAMHEADAAQLAARPGWTTEPEVSFSIYGERGVIDILAWHAERRVLLDGAGPAGPAYPFPSSSSATISRWIWFVPS